MRSMWRPRKHWSGSAGQWTILNETMICFTDKPDPIIRKIELWMKHLREDKECGYYHGGKARPDVLEGYDIRILLGKNRVTIQGLNYGTRCVDDLSREFKSLTFVLLSGAKDHFRIMDCSMGYGGKQLFRASRGTAGTLEPSVIPNVILESPFLTLSDGELAASFEAVNIENSICSLEKLLDAPIHPSEESQLIKSGDHLRVFSETNN